jgi:nitric oxide reductase NorD protein
MTSRERSSAEALAARLAAVSRLVADQLAETLPAIETALGADVERWLALGLELAASGGTTAGATLTFLRLEPARVRRTGLARLAAWVDAVVTVDHASPVLGAAFADASAELAGEIDPAWLARYAEAAVALRADGGWRGERLAQAMVAAAPAAARALGAGELEAWSRLAATLRPALDEGLFFRALPATVGTWTASERSSWLGIVAGLARRHVPTAAAYYRDLPATIADVPAALRAELLAVVAEAASGARPTSLHAVLPLLGALVLDVPPAARATALAAAARTASEFPGGAVALLRTLPKLFEEGVPPHLERWVDHGLAIAAENADAGCAYFALESRTSVSVLRASPVAVALEEVQGVTRKVVQMLSGWPASPHGVGRFQLRPPLDATPSDPAIALPSSIDLLATYEGNRRLYAVLAAWLAGRRLYDTYDDTIAPALAAEDAPPFLEDLFLLADGYRVAHRLAAEYPGVATDLAWACRSVLAAWGEMAAPPTAVVFDAILALALDPRAAELAVAPWLAASPLAVLPLLRPLADPHATAADALATAARLVPLFAQLVVPSAVDPMALEFLPILLDAGDGDGPFASGLDVDDDAGVTLPTAPERLPEDLLRELQVALDQRRAGEGSGTQLSLDELRRLLESGLLGDLAQGSGTDLDANGLYVTQLVGKLLGERRDPRRAGPDGVGPRRVARIPRPADESPIFFYDEWDHAIEDYRPAWCQLREIAVADDAGVFYEHALARHADLVPELRRCFQQVRPDRYRVQRGLEDGEDIDWHAVVEARVERRVRGTASTKLYTARTRQEREVATLFLLDMSASTDEAAAGSVAAERIIDIAKDALAIMAAALDEIGDTFAIYGFSGQGRERVEVYPVKGFDERLSPAVKGRLGGIEPKGSTRMGTALRHATALMPGLSAPAQHLVLISDGFPQDLDYGDDRQSHVYGIRDTATALRETQAAGIKPFCITVDLAGHDYLREMCDPDAYVVIERVADLPRELPRIYQRLVRAA